MADFYHLDLFREFVSIFFLCFEIGLGSGILILFPFFFYLNCIFGLMGGMNLLFLFRILWGIIHLYLQDRKSVV